MISPRALASSASLAIKRLISSSSLLPPVQRPGMAKAKPDEIYQR